MNSVEFGMITALVITLIALGKARRSPPAPLLRLDFVPHKSGHVGVNRTAVGMEALACNPRLPEVVDFYLLRCQVEGKSVQTVIGHSSPEMARRCASSYNAAQAACRHPEFSPAALLAASA